MDKLKSMNDEGELPKSRIGSAYNARQLVNNLRTDEEERTRRRTKISGLLDGNSPWSHKKLKDIGQAHRANFNLREGEGAVDAAKTPYYDLVFEVPRFANVKYYLYGAPEELNNKFSEILSDEYHDILDSWEGFDQQIQLHQWQMVVFGVGPMFWPHSLDWRSEAVKAGKMLVPPETKANVEDLEMVVVLHSYRADQLEGFIQNESAAEKAGWDVKEVKNAIIKAAHTEIRELWGNDDFDLYQRAIRCGDYFYAHDRSNRIYVASLFIREFGGKVSHYIITDTPTDDPDEKPVTEIDEEEVGYLFVKKKKFDSFAQVVRPAFFDTGPDGTWHSIKGLGPKIFDFCDISNRMTCQGIDGAVIGSGVTLEAQDANSLEETQLSLIGGGTVVSPGYKVVQTRIAESLNGLLAMKRDLQNTLQSNTGNYRQRVSGETQEPTLGQAQLNVQQQGSLTKGSVNRYYNGFLDGWHYETLRRLMNPALKESDPGGKEAAKFKKCCLERGLPEELFDFKNVLKVKAVRSVGYGSPQMRDIATKELLGMMPMLDEVGRNNALRARLASLPGIGQSQVDSYAPSIKEKGFPDDHASFATTENNALRMHGGEALVAPQQNHATHFQVHMADAMTHVQQVMGQGQNGSNGQGMGPQNSPIELLIHLEQAGPHLHQHLQQIAGDPTRKTQIKQFQKQWQDLSHITDKVQKEVDKYLQEQAQQQPPAQPDPEKLAPLLKVQGDLQLKAKKQTGDLALKAHKQMHTERLADLKTAAEIRRRNVESQRI